MTDFPFGFQLPGGGGSDPVDPAQMQAFLAQLQQVFASPSDGPVNWNLARQLAEQTARDGDRSLTAAERDAVGEALRLADLWLDPVTSLPSGVTAPAAWSRLEWIGHTMDTWRTLCDPVAGRVVGAMTQLVPDELRAQLGPMAGMLGSIGGVMFGGQVGQGIGQLSTEVLGTSDIGLPLGPAGTAALLPANLAAFAAGLERPEEEVRLYVALREAAHQRLFGHVPWLRSHLVNAVDAYARGISVDRQAIEDAMSQVDPANPESIQEALAGGLFRPEDTPEQQAALNRLETALALVEGWVAHVVEAATAGRLPGAPALAEAFRRRRAAGGPAEQTFATLVGLELRPRRLREATALWTALTEHRGAEGRDEVWGHPDLLPSSDDLDDPEGFARRTAEVEMPGLDDL
ncbi:MAG TPA: zinc-dependent metalloprotease [Mycobacteriales bacterium]